MKYRVLLTVLSILTITSVWADTKNKSSILSLKESITDNDIQYPASFDSSNDMIKDWFILYHDNNSPIIDQNDSNYGSVSDRVYKERLLRLPTSIEMPFNQIVKSYIERYVIKGRSLVSRLLGMSPYYMPIFEAALERHQMPLELKYIPIIESALNPNAVSPAGAGGLWQFMPATAKGHGMEVSGSIDERRDPYASSEKAAVFFQKLYNTYGDWSLAIAAYNCGPGNVNKAIKRTGNDKADFWEIYNYLPKETRGYVPAFIAANYAMTYYKEHGITPQQTRPIIVDTVMVNKRVSFRQISQVLNIPVEEIRILNPQYRNDVIPGNVHPYVLALPNQMIYSYIKDESRIINGGGGSYYAKNDKKTDDNDDDDDDDDDGKNDGTYDKDDDQYYSYNSNQSRDRDKGNSEPKSYRVKDDEDLYDIADRFGVQIDDIMELNKIETFYVEPGTMIKLPQAVNYRGSDDEDEFAAYYDSNYKGSNYSNSNRYSSYSDTPQDEMYSSSNSSSMSRHYGSDNRPVPERRKRDDTPSNVPQRRSNQDDDYYGSNNYSQQQNDYEQEMKRKQEEAENKRRQQEAAAKKKREQEAAAKKKREQEAAAKKKREQEAAAKKKQKEELAKKKREEEAAKKKREEEERKRREEAAKPITHEVKEGNNLIKLAKQYNTTPEKIKELNNLKDDNIRIGQKLKIPKKK